MCVIKNKANYSIKEVNMKGCVSLPGRRAYMYCIRAEARGHIPRFSRQIEALEEWEETFRVIGSKKKELRIKYIWSMFTTGNVKTMHIILRCFLD
ncbi:hypothetical protein RRG08_015648 [Elysia crispata]|uniref:Uncharacterized protein n=1 Tax=Elysia crispata TaxID=231223 RepID=A0AAE1DEI8_9GAST|nr:hypothetical protein RRG08_015648 [Elysia crispata]